MTLAIRCPERARTRGRRRATGVILALAALVTAISPTLAPAALIMELSPTTQNTPAGGTGSFDVVLVDTGGTFQVSGFTVDLTVPGPSGINFTGVTTSTTTSPYIFGTYQSAPAPFATPNLPALTFPATGFTASDVDFTAPFFATLTTGQSVGLAHVSYAVASGTTLGPVTVTFVPPPSGSSLSDPAGAAIPFTTQNGTITVIASVPEPSSMLLTLAGGCAVGGLVVAARRRRPSA